MSRRLFELAVRARRLVTRPPPARAPRGGRLTAQRQLGGGRADAVLLSPRLHDRPRLRGTRRARRRGGWSRVSAGRRQRGCRWPSAPQTRVARLPRARHVAGSPPPLIRDLHEEPIAPPLEIREPRRLEPSNVSRVSPYPKNATVPGVGSYDTSQSVCNDADRRRLTPATRSDRKIWSPVGVRSPLVRCA